MVSSLINNWVIDVWSQCKKKRDGGKKWRRREGGPAQVLGSDEVWEVEYDTKYWQNNPCSVLTTNISTVLHCTVLCSHVLFWPHIFALYCTVLYCTVLYCTVLYCTVLYCTVLYCTVLYCTVLYCTVLYCTVLYCTVLHCTVLCSHVLFWPHIFTE